jgi:hypothetical protein
MEHSNDLQGHLIGAIDNQIRPEWRESDGQIRKVLALLALPRHRGKTLEAFEKLFLKPILQPRRYPAR